MCVFEIHEERNFTNLSIKYLCVYAYLFISRAFGLSIIDGRTILLIDENILYQIIFKSHHTQ